MKQKNTTTFTLKSLQTTPNERRKHRFLLRIFDYYFVTLEYYVFQMVDLLKKIKVKF